MNNQVIELGVSDFVAVFNQTLEGVYPEIIVVGEIANFRVSQRRWVYFDIKDETASIRCFGTIYSLPGPLEDGMMAKVRGRPHLHERYGFSINILSIQLAGEGTLRRAADLLKVSLTREGLFDPARKRLLPEVPARIGLITAKQSAAYADFIKILNARWGRLDIDVVNVQVQGEVAPSQIAAAIAHLNTIAPPLDVLTLIRGGGSSEDLAAFNSEQVTRAVAGSRIPTLVAIGHEIDFTLAELAADCRASTPSNAAELLVPEKKQILRELRVTQHSLTRHIAYVMNNAAAAVSQYTEQLDRLIRQRLQRLSSEVDGQAQLLEAFNPTAVLKRGYAIVRHNGRVLRNTQALSVGNMIEVQLMQGALGAVVENIGEESKR